MELQGKVALITGGASGFGEATAKLFAEKGAKVAIVDLDEEKLDKVKETIVNAGGEAIAVKADTTNETEVKESIDRVIKEFGQLDTLMINAGVYIPGTVEDSSLKDWQTVLDVNLTGAFLYSKYAISYLKKSKGNIITTSSAASFIGFPDAISYAATKGGINAFTKAMAIDYADDGVRVNSISPGTGETGMTSMIMEDEKLREHFLEPIPLKSFAQPEDVAYAALYLAGDHAKYITGIDIPVDGGRVIL